MNGEEKYIEQLRRLNEQLNVVTKLVATKIKNGEDATKEKEILKNIFNEKKDLTEDYIGKRDQEILKRCIKKEDLIDGEWYWTDKEGQRVARYVEKAQWLKDKNMFLAPGQQQFGADGYLHYFGDVIDTRYAGFPPMKKVDE